MRWTQGLALVSPHAVFVSVCGPRCARLTLDRDSTVQPAAFQADPPTTDGDAPDGKSQGSSMAGEHHHQLVIA